MDDLQAIEHRSSRIRRRCGAIAILLAAGPGAIPVCRSQVYSVTQIPQLSSPASGAEMAIFAAALNDVGQVTGSIEAGNQPQAFLFNDGITTDLDTFGKYYSFGTAINNSGQVVGWASLSGIAGPYTAFIYSSGVSTSIGMSSEPTAIATGINASGQVSGYDQTGAFLYSSGSTQYIIKNPTFPVSLAEALALNDSGEVTGLGPFLFSNGTLTSVNTPNGTPAGSGEAINAAGQIAGIFGTSGGATHAFLYTSGTAVDLGTLGGLNSVIGNPAGSVSVGGELPEPHALNSSGQVTGFSDTANGASHAFLFAGGTMRDLGTLGGNQSHGAAINDAGEVTGWAETADGAQHAFLYANGQMIDLNSLIDPGSALKPYVTLQAGVDISNTGFILAQGVNSQTGGLNVSFLLQLETITLTVAPPTLSFGNSPVGTATARQAVTVHNAGIAAFNLNPLQLTGDFTQTNDCGASLAAGAGCTINIAFLPSAPGSRAGVLTVGSGYTTYVVNLSGVGTVTATISASASTVTVGGSFTLTWAASANSPCTATGGGPGDGWSGTVLASSGAQKITESKTGTYTYGVTCGASGQTAQASANVFFVSPGSGGGGGLDPSFLVVLLSICGLSRSKAIAPLKLGEMLKKCSHI
jgi:probable HAF family extracellular repeat protein